MSPVVGRGRGIIDIGISLNIGFAAGGKNNILREISESNIKNSTIISRIVIVIDDKT